MQNGKHLLFYSGQHLKKTTLAVTPAAFKANHYVKITGIRRKYFRNREIRNSYLKIKKKKISFKNQAIFQDNV